jgi:hypothetical protein
MCEGSKSFAGRNISFNAAGALSGLLDRPQPALTGSLNSYHEFVEGGAFKVELLDKVDG